MQSSIGQTFFSLLGNLHLRPLQMCLLSVWRPHILPLDHQIMISSMIWFHLKWLMDTSRFVTGIPLHPPEPNVFLCTDASHYGWGAHLEPMRLSFHGRWTEDQSQLHINILEMMAIHFALIEANIYSLFLCHDIYRQHNSGLLYQQTRRNSLSQPMYRGLEDPQFVSGTWYRCQSSSYSRQIQCFGGPPLQIGQTYQNRMGIGSNDSELHIPNA